MIPSSVPWRVCDRCERGHSVGGECERKASRVKAEAALAAMRGVVVAERFVPPSEESAA